MKTKILTLLAFCCFAVSGLQAANEIYATWTTATQTVTLYYDDQRESSSGTTSWWTNDILETATTVILDATMKNARPTSTEYWFSNFSKLTKIEHLDYLNTSEVTDMNGMFIACKSLTSLDLSSFNTANVTDMQYMFYNCASLTSLNLKSFNTSKVTNMESMFQSCHSLTSLDLSNFNTANVTDMQYMFYNCASLTSLDLSNFNTANVTNMRSMFWCCSRLQALNVTSFNTDKVQSMCCMFGYNSSLKSLDLRSFNTPKVEDMREMFYACTQLITIYCANNWRSQLQVLTSADGMFTNCKQLVGENGTQYDANYTDITYARPDGVDGKKGYFTKSPKEVYTVFNDGTGTLTYCYDKYRQTRPGTKELYDPSVTRFSSYNDKVTKVEIDASLKEAILTSTQNMFFGGTSSTTLKNLTVIEGLDNLNTSLVTNMSNMFAGCTKLTSLDVSHFNIDNVSNMDYMFSGCSALKTIYCNDDWSASDVSSSSYMFSGCTALVGGNGTTYNSAHTNITYARPDNTEQAGYFTEKQNKIYTAFIESTGTLTYYYDDKYISRTGVIEFYDPINQPNAERFNGYNEKITKVKIDPFMYEAPLTSTVLMFCGGIPNQCLKSLTQIEGLENLNTENVTNMSFMFDGCSSLTSLDLISFNTKNVTNMSGMFDGCKGLISIELSSTFSTGKVTNMSNMFSECAKLQVLDFSSFDTENVTDMRNMFYNCKALKSLDLSMFKTTNLQRTTLMFKNCSSLTTIYCNNDWSTEATALINSDNMFVGCTKLVGGLGTEYDANIVDVTYARPDKAGQPGYFTASTPTQVANVQSNKDKGTKFIRNGQFFILRDGKTYSVTGQKVK